MREVLTRRFTRGMREREGLEDSHGFSRYPDLIMMDGGRGQVNIALDVLKELGLNIPVCGMVRMIPTAQEVCIITILRYR